jgi:hypothetical protein
MVYIPPKLNQNCTWHIAFNLIGRAYIRVPAIIGGAYLWNNYFIHPETEKFYNWWNAGWSQKDMWIGVEQRTKLRQEGKWGPKEEESSE